VNYLVHLYLAGPSKMNRLGAIMGDFVKGQLDQSLPGKIRQGLQHHRRIDWLAHTSSHTRRSRQRLDPRFGHARTILVDIFYDHLLACFWNEFSCQSLEAFASEIYAMLFEEQNNLPEGLKRILPHMTRNNWLVSYRNVASIENALSRIAEQLSRKTPLEESIIDLSIHHDDLRIDFEEFINEAIILGQEEFGITIHSNDD
jgi:acyl carrier protein phosphodiesterase